MNTTVTVALAACRGEKYIAGQLRSIFSQTRVPDELLIGDDSPDDATRRIIDALQHEVPRGTRMTVLNRAKQLGINANFRDLMARASGDFIFFCDQDDVWLPDKIECVAAELEAHPGALAVLSRSAATDAGLRLSPEGRDAEKTLLDRVEDEINSGRAFFYYATDRLVGAGHNLAVRREFAQSVPPFEGRWLYDCHLTKTAALLEKLRVVNRVLALHRFHADNATTRLAPPDNRNAADRLRRIASNAPARDEIADFLADLIEFRTRVTGRSFPAPVPSANLRLLDRLIVYFECRRKLRLRPLPLRLLIPPGLLRDYFALGNRWRSLGRDLLLGR